jgi:hypothetical protein
MATCSCSLMANREQENDDREHFVRAALFLANRSVGVRHVEQLSREANRFGFKREFC